MRQLAVILAAILMSACLARVGANDEIEAARAEIGACLGDDTECAIAHHIKAVGAISESCQDAVRATTIHWMREREAYEFCPGYDFTVWGCAYYGDDGGAVYVVANYDSFYTTVHELTHIALHCGQGDPDATHTRFPAAWLGLLND